MPQAVRDGPALASPGGHFLVHYADPTTAQTAAHVGDVLEAALARDVGEWGWPAPVDDGDGRVDVYLFTQPDIEGAANPDPGPRPTSGWIQTGADESDIVIAQELLHVLQYAIGVHEPAVYVTEGTAHWAGNRFAGDEGQLVSVPLWANSNYLGTPLDCPASSPCHNNAGPATAGWAFFEYLAERFGPQIVVDAYTRGVEAALAAVEMANLTAGVKGRESAARESAASRQRTANTKGSVKKKYIPRSARNNKPARTSSPTKRRRPR